MTDFMVTTQHYRRMLREVQYSVIQLIYQDNEWEGLAKDYEFSPESMREHWASGLLDIERPTGASS